MIVCVLIFLEIIIIGICDLQKNTIKEIINREREELQMINSINAKSLINEE